MKKSDWLPSNLILETGEIFSGLAPYHQQGSFFGEVVFNTGMVGYVESLTDPSYCGQILAFTYPLIGNYGVPDALHWESEKIQVSGVVMSELALHYSNFEAKHSLATWLYSNNIPYITHVDTRALTSVLRSTGIVMGAITDQEKLTDFPIYSTEQVINSLAIKEPIYYGFGEKVIIAIDCGMKNNILRCLQKFPIRIKRVPYDYDYTNEEFDGIFLSNGPGDPKCYQKTIAILKKALAIKKPIFGICLGVQLLGLAIGANTYKMKFGHRSHNQPCLDLKAKRCYLTSQNHGFAIEQSSLPDDWQTLFINLNDNSVAGIEHKKLPYFAVQFHPEASPGPMDTQWLFKKFIDSL